jgi:predicted AlkP superfamily phosphohydrolase/phosphomutase
MQTKEKRSERPHKVILLGIDGADPCLIRKFSAEGLLPNISRMLERGFFTEAVPSITAKTPQNWTTIATGAEPGTHEITDLFIQSPDKPIDYMEKLKRPWNDFSETDEGVLDIKPSQIFINLGFRSDLSKAEFIWNTCEDNGKKVIVFNYACATPATLREGIWIGGSGAPDSFSAFTIDKPRTFILDDSNVKPTQSIKNLPINIKIFRIWKKNLCRERQVGLHPIQIIEFQDDSGKRVAIIRDNNWNDKIALLNENEHSKYIVDVFYDPETNKKIKAAYKFILLNLDRSIKLHRTKIFPVEGLSTPPGVYEELIEKFGPFMEFAKPHVEEVGVQTFVELQQELNDWIARSVVYLYNKYVPDLLMVKTHLVDNFIHTLMSGYSRFLEGEVDYKEEFDAVIEAYRIMDEMIGIVAKNVPSDVNLLVVSDHGGIPGKYRIPVNTILANAGLVKIKIDAKGNRIVDYRNSKCLAIPLGGYIHINLEGRQPGGIVPLREYEKVQDQIIDTLLEFVCPVTKKHPFVLVCRKQDAGILGVNENSMNTGDIIFCLRTPFRVDPIDLLSAGLPDFEDHEWMKEYSNEHFVHHGDWMPGVRYKGMSDLGVFMGRGPSLKEGYVHKNVFRLTGVAPTISRILDIPSPKNSEGGALYSALQS